MPLNCINLFGQTKLVAQSIMHMKIYVQPEKKNDEQIRRRGKLGLLNVTWIPSHRRIPQTEVELACISERRK